MNSDHPLDRQEQNEDLELNVLLKKWQAPEVPAVLDARIAEEAQRQFRHMPLWKRLLTARIPVPAPAAVLALVLLSATTFLAVRSLKPTPASTPQAAAAQAKIDIPAPRMAEANPAKATEVKADLRPVPAAKKADPGSAYVTHVDLTGFEPVKELKIRILPRGNNNER
jgi:hypothetical protein